MSPTLCCGFECGQLGGVGQHWSKGGLGAATFDTTTKRNGDRSLRLNTTANVAQVATPTLSSQAVSVMRVAIRFGTLPNVNLALVKISNGEGALFNVSDGKIYAADSSGAMGATGVSVTTGLWYVVDVLVDQRINPWKIDVRVNGVNCGQKIRFVAASSATSWVLGSGNSSTADIYFDDFILTSDAADYPIGDGYVNHFVPTADGTHNISGAADFRRGDTITDILNSTTTAYQLVDEVPLDDTTPDADDHIRIVAPAAATDYVELVFGPAPGISTPTVAPRAVEVITEVFAAGTGLADEQIKVNDNGTVDTLYDGTGIAGIVTGTYKRKHYPLAPTGGAWTVAAGAGDFNNLRLRYGYSTDANPDKSLMCAMVEAEFAALATGRRRINVT